MDYCRRKYREYFKAIDVDDPEAKAKRKAKEQDRKKHNAMGSRRATVSYPSGCVYVGLTSCYWPAL